MYPSEALAYDPREAELADWREREKSALDLLQIAGELRFDRAIDFTIFRRLVYDCRASQVLQALQRSQDYSKRPIGIDLVLSLAYAVAQLDHLHTCKVDLGRLATEWLTRSGGYANMDAFVVDRLRDLAQALPPEADAADAGRGAGRDVVLYGFGRIGRIVARQLALHTGRGHQLRLRGIVLRPRLSDAHEELTKRAALLRSDSVHGNFDGIVEVSPDAEYLVVNGASVKVFWSDAPEEPDYLAHGIRDALLIDNTGAYRTREELERHLRPGIRSVLLTAPGEEVPNIVFGVNHGRYNWSAVRLASAASCTTNAVAPILSAMSSGLGIARAHIDALHAYTSDQNLLDNFHRKPRRGRSAASNMIITPTSAARAAEQALPALAGRLTANSVRIPIPSGSLAVLNLTVDRPTNRDEVNEIMRQAALDGPICEQILYSNSPEYASANVIGHTATAVFDAPATVVSADGLGVTLHVWYDNEYGYACQVMRLAKLMAGVHRARYI